LPDFNLNSELLNSAINKIIQKTEKSDNPRQMKLNKYLKGIKKIFLISFFFLLIIFPLENKILYILKIIKYNFYSYILLDPTSRATINKNFDKAMKNGLIISNNYLVVDAIDKSYGMFPSTLGNVGVIEIDQIKNLISKTIEKIIKQIMDSQYPLSISFDVSQIQNFDNYINPVVKTINLQ